jgi:hypothetical protein
MTVLVGIKCKDGVVIGSDGAATFSNGQVSTIQQPTKKIRIIRNKFILAGTGSIGLGQRFGEAVEQATLQNALANKSGIAAAVAIAGVAKGDFARTSVRAGQYGALMAFPTNGGLHLVEFDSDQLQPELKDENIWFASMGSGQAIADPFLGLMRAAFWQNGLPSLQEGIFATVWTIQHCIDLNPGGVKEPPGYRCFGVWASGERGGTFSFDG